MQILIILETVLLYRAAESADLIVVRLRKTLPSLLESKISGVRCRFAGVGRHRQRTWPSPQLPTCGYAVWFCVCDGKRWIPTAFPLSWSIKCVRILASEAHWPCVLAECDVWLEWSVWPHSCLLCGFPAYNLTWHILLPGSSEQRNAPTHLHVHIHARIHAHTPPCSVSLFLGCMHADTHICHLHGDSRGIGLWWEIYTSDRWALLGLTGTERRVAGEEEEMKVGGVGEELERSAFVHSMGI